MKQIPIVATANTPGVVYDSEAGFISIEGRSIPENPAEFYSILSDWTFGILKKPYPKIVMEFRLDYINSSSAKQILNFLKGMASSSFPLYISRVKFGNTLNVMGSSPPIDPISLKSIILLLSDVINKKYSESPLEIEVIK